MNEKLNDALDEISDKHIAEAAKKKKRKTIHYIGAIAAVLAVVILVNSFSMPISAKAVSLAEYTRPDDSYYNVIPEYIETLTPFFTANISQVLSGSDGENQAYSPANLYMGLSAVAELSGGDEQIMAALNAEDLSALRQMTLAIWSNTFSDKDNPCLLANSLWLDSDLTYDQTTMDTLAEYHYTSVYQGDFGTRRTNRDISNWLNRQTGNLLKDSADNIDLNADTVFALYSTIYYQAKWTDEFKASDNRNGLFHAPSGDVECTYMNAEKIRGDYYWGTDFGAIAISLKGGSRMWLILPDEDKTVDDVLASEEYAQMIFGDWENSKYMYINLSLPKFDIRSSGDLKEDLQALGITNVFDPYSADFSAAMPDFDQDVWLSAVNQSTRVAIDEKGVTAASYIEFPGAGAAAPPEEIIDFVLDRPFLFVVTNYMRIPLFAGVVNEP